MADRDPEPSENGTRAMRRRAREAPVLDLSPDCQKYARHVYAREADPG